VSRPSYEELEDEVRVLRARLAEVSRPLESARLCALLRMRPQQGRLLSYLLGRTSATKAMIYTAVFEDEDGGGPDDKIIHVTIFRIRQALVEARAPGAIETLGQSGYGINGPLRSWLTERLADPVAAVAA